MLTLNDIKVGQVAELVVEVTEKFVSDFAKFSGDTNPIHMDSDYANKTRYRRRVAHGLSYVSMFSQLLSTRFHGCVMISQQFDYKKASCIGDVLTLSIKVKKISKSTNTVSLGCEANNQDNETTLHGEIVILLSELQPDSKEITTDASDRLTLVVAGSRGIGASIVEKMIANGHKVGFTYNRSKGEALLLAKKFPDCEGFQADAGDKHSVQTLITDLSKRFGRLPDTIVFGASASPSMSTNDTLDFSPYAKHLSYGLRHCHEILGHCLPNMIENKFGNIVIIGTIYTEVAPPPRVGPYLVGKAALVAFSKAIAVDYGQYGIRANVVAPSMTQTSMLASVPERELKVAAYHNPMRRLAMPSDIANAVSFLVSNESSYVNGETLVVSGGSVIS